MSEEPIFKKGEKVWVFGGEKGIIIKETGFRIFLVKIESRDGVEMEVDYVELLKRYI